MYIREITYTDYAGEKRTEKFAFNLNKAELAEWLTGTGEYTIDKAIMKMYDKGNARDIMATFKDLIYRSYGEISVDDKRFIKSKEVKDQFMESEAYSELFMELLTNANKAAEFFNHIIPKDLADEVSKIMKENPGALPDNIKEYVPKETTQE